MFDQFRDWAKDRHDYARAWKKKHGGKVVGYFCTYAPEELMYAAGILPVRILGSHEPQDVTEPHIFGGMFCPFCRDCLAQGLKGRYEYLDGVMISQSCLHIRQAFTSWVKHVPVEYSYYLPMPNRVQSPRAHPYLEGELRSFQASLEKWLGKRIAESDLDQAIAVYNENRRHLHRLYALRKGDTPPLTGEEAMEVTLSNQVTDKKDHSRALQELLEKLPSRNPLPPAGTRLMLVGSEDDDLPFIRMLESLGSSVVTDEHCTGTRYFWNEVIPNENRLSAIARRYVDRPPCPSKDWETRSRLDHLLRLAKDYRVQGAVLIQQKFCDPHELDIPAIRKLFEVNGIPTLFLEFDVTVPMGQFKIRCEAFLEMLKSEELF